MKNVAVDATQTLSKYIADSRFSGLPDDVTEQAKLCILDSLGCAIGGSTLEAGKIVLKLMTEIGGKPESTLIPSGRRVPIVHAAYANSHLASLMDFDDKAPFRRGHPGACIVPPALAVGEAMGSSGCEVINAIVLGYEVHARITDAIQPSPGRQATVTGPGTRHIFGAVTAACALMHLDAKATATALGLAGVNAPVPSSPTGRGERPVSWSKFNSGWASEGGVLAALLAQRGFVGSRTILDGDKGFWVMAGSDRCHFEEFTRGLGQEYTVRKLSFKAFPCCRYLHGSIEAVKQITAEHDIDLASVEKIHVRSFSRVGDLLDYTPSNEIDAQFSLPYVIALGLIGKPPGYEWLSERNFRDPTVLALARKVTFEVDQDADRKFREEAKESSMVLITVPGREFEAHVAHPRGLLTRVEIHQKFRGLAEPVLGGPVTEEMITAVEGIEDCRNVSSLLRLGKTAEVTSL